MLIFNFHRSGAQQGAGDERLLTHEGQGHLRRIQPVFLASATYSAIASWVCCPE